MSELEKQEKSARQTRTIKEAGLYIVVFGFLAFIWFPIIWDITMAFKGEAEWYTWPVQLFPSQPTLDNFVGLIDEGVLNYVRNTAIVTTSVTLISLLVATLACYSLTRWDPGKGKVTFFIISVRFLPPVTPAIPLYLMLTNVGLVNTLQGLILVELMVGIPICTWMLFPFFKLIPRVLEEAIMVDGYSRLGSLKKVILPLAAPGMAAAAIFTAIIVTNEFTLALIFTADETSQTLPIYLETFMTTRGIWWGWMAAASLFAIIPVITLAFLIQRKMVTGFTMGTIKG